MSKSTSRSRSSHERVIFTLPRPLAAELREFADAFRGGNKSGFAADALRAYIDWIRKARRTKALRQGYAASSRRSLKVAAEWDAIDDEAWRLLDRRPASGPAGRR